MQFKNAFYLSGILKQMICLQTDVSVYLSVCLTDWLPNLFAAYIMDLEILSSIDFSLTFYYLIKLNPLLLCVQ